MRLLAGLIALWATVTALTIAGGDQTEPNPDEEVLRAAGLSADGPALLSFFQERVSSNSDSDKLLSQARQLGDASAEVRSRTAARLIARGAAAIPVLRHIVNDLTDPVAAEQAVRCLEWLEGTRRNELPVAAARLLAARKPAGAADALLAYLPFAEDETVIDGVKAALITLARSATTPEPALLNALKDPVPLRRAIVVEVLSSADQRQALPQVRKLLADANDQVRLRVALALVERQEEEAVGNLIDLLADLPPAQRRVAEDALQHLAGDWSPNPALAGDDAVSRKIRRDAWVGWWRNTDGPALLAAFRQRTLNPDEVTAVRTLIEKLGDQVFAVREKAAAQLVSLGTKVVPLLREASQGPDLERSQRAKNCLKQIGQNEDKNRLPVAAARLLAIRRPTGATEALLAYLPFTDDEPMQIEVRKALKELMSAAGKPELALVQALTDSMAIRRAAAGEVLSGADEHRALVRNLLHDPDPSVRLQVALALVHAKDKEAVPALIDLIAELPKGQAWEAEDLLYRAAGSKAPQATVGDDAASRQRFRDAWDAWWKDHSAGVDLAQLEVTQALLGFTLVAELSQNNANLGRVLELDRNGKPRWQIENIGSPMDVRLLPGNRVLIAEGNANRVTERDLKGNILWQINALGPGGYPVNVQRLPNGNTFIACANNGQLLEVNRAGTTVFNTTVSMGVRAAYKMTNGQMVCLTNQAFCVRLDAAGKEIKRFPLLRIGQFTSGIDVTPRGHILVAQSDNTVTEYDLDGKVVWQAKANANTSATRLLNGHTLVASHQGQSVVELDGAGRIVWEYKAPPGHGPFRARQR